MRRTLWATLVVCALSSATPALAQQATCPTGQASDTLVCLIPQVYGPNGLILPNPFHQAHFLSSFQGSFTPLTSAMGTQLTQLPLASPSSGITFSWDSVAKVFVPSTESFGPILSERSETVGRRKLVLGFSYQRFDFDSLSGLDLNSLPAVFTHVDIPPAGLGTPSFENDIIATRNDIDLKVNQFTLFASFGITNRIDVSVAVPIVDVKMRVTSDALIIRNAPPGPFGESHFFDASDPTGSVRRVFTASNTATGVGDVTLRVKGTAWRGERSGLALGFDVRTPTGDELDLLGSGAVGLKPFVVWSYRSRISPHVNVGFEWNGNSRLAGDLTSAADTKASLPETFFYAVGADVWLNKRVSMAVDLLGQRLFNADRVSATTFTDVSGQSFADVAVGEDSFNITNLAVGVRLRPVGRMLLTANLLIRLDDGGLRADLVPLVGITYTF